MEPSNPLGVPRPGAGRPPAAAAAAAAAIAAEAGPGCFRASEASHDPLLGRQHLLQQRNQGWGYWGRGIRDVARHSALAVASCRRDAVGGR